ncbi:MAG: hypothetical protein OSA78_02365 [Flavobacteriales bacterium]|nr:hypothetical protein [Flavobacteriales bacterium]
MNRLLLLCCLVFSLCAFAAEDRASLTEEVANRNISFELFKSFEHTALADTVFGCTYSWAFGFDADATLDDGSCLDPMTGFEIAQTLLDPCDCPGDMNDDGFISVVDLIVILGLFGDPCEDIMGLVGCTNEIACNYDPEATIENQSCEFETCAGCTDPVACNFDPEATFENFSCVFPEPGEACDPCDCLVDVTPPTILSAPSNQVNECSELPFEFEVTDSCQDPSEVEVSFARDTLSSDECGNYHHVVTFIAKDQCGNEANATFEVIVQDNTEPYLTSGAFPSNISISCTEEWPSLPSSLLAEDSCDGELPIYFNETIVQGNCQGEFDIERTWLVTDCSANDLQHVQVISIIDDEAPIFISTPSDQVNGCTEQPFEYEAFDNCNEVSVTESREILFEDSCGNYEHLVTLTASDACGNFTDFSFTIVVQDTIAPIWDTSELPESTTASCNAIPTAPNLFASDACDGLVEVLFNESSEASNCLGQAILIRQWTAIDCTGNSISHEQTIQIEDTIAPEFNEELPVDATVECDAIPMAAELTGIDNCDSDPIVDFTESVDSGACQQTYTLIRVWTLSDCAGNQNSHIQTLEVLDTTAPVFVEMPLDQTNACEEQPYTYEAMDNCGLTVISELRETLSSDSCGNYEDIVTLTAIDECGNSADYQFTITVQDGEAPVFTEALPPSGTVECNEVPAAAILNATDNCGAEVAMNFQENIEDGSCPQSYTITRTWNASDCTGNTVEHIQVINVQDSTAPSFTDLPIDQTNECEEQAYSAAASDLCGTTIVTESRETISSDACGNYEHLVTLTAIDECGNAANYQFTIVVQDNESPVFAETLPDNLNLSCDEEVPAAITLTASDNCNPNIQVLFNEDLDSSDPCQIVIARKWSANDCTGNTVEHVQIINVVDDIAPEWTELPPSEWALEMDSECQADTSVSALGTPIATDACNALEISHIDVDFETLSCGSNYMFTRIWTAEDLCGNASSYAQSILVEDFTPPAFTQSPVDLDISCDELADSDTWEGWIENNGGAQAIDNCSAITWSHDFDGLPQGCGGSGSVIVMFTASDECGNSSSISAEFIISDDTEPEITDAQNLLLQCDGDGNSDDIQVWLTNNGGATATDVCSGVTWSYNFDSEGVNCGSAGFYLVTFTATDDCGNSANSTGTITIEDTTPPVITQATDATVACDDAANDEALVGWLADNGGASATDVCGEVTWTHDFASLSDECGSTGAAMVTFTATDECGNASSASASFTIEDLTSPTIVQAVDTTVECDNTNNTEDLEFWLSSNGGASAVDACSEVIWSNDFTGLSDECGSTGAATVTFTASDDCGNTTSTTATFAIVDTTSPIVENARDTTFSCDGLGNELDFILWLENNGGATAVDACSTVTWSNNAEGLTGGCAQETTVEFTATDACGNITTTSATFTVVDSDEPILDTFASDILIECQENNGEALFNWIMTNGGATASDACGDITWSNNFVGLEPNCGNSGAASITFTATDECGNSVSTQAMMSVVDTTAPTITDALDVTVECDGNGNEEQLETWLTNHGGALAEDLCGMIQWSYVDEMSAGTCNETSVHVTTFVATDDCGNAATIVATFTIEDTTAPVFTEIPVNQISQCEEAEYTASALDQCGAVELTESRETIGADECGNYEHLVTLTAIDGCGNSTEHQFTIIVQDTEAPSFVEALPEDITAACLDPIEDPIELTAVDNCEDILVSYEQDSIPANCSSEYTLVRIWTATDCSGNSTQHIQTIEVVDLIAPSLIIESCPQDIEVFLQANCTFNAEPDNIGWPVVIATDDCSDPEVFISFEDATPETVCGGALNFVRTFNIEAIDACGLVSIATCSQSIAVTDSIAPVFDLVPTDMIFECEEGTYESSASDNCGVVDIMETREVISENGCGNYEHLVTLTAADPCGNSATVQFTILVQDNTSPEWTTAVPTNMSIGCGELEEALAMEAIDNCDGAMEVMFSEEVIGSGQCGSSFAVIRTWSTEDCSGNVLSTTQEITVADNLAPIWTTTTPLDITVECSDVPEPMLLSATDNCDNEVEVVLEETILDGICSSQYTLIRTWIATDDCGNVATTSQTIEIVDNTPPVWVETLPTNVTVGCDNIPDFVNLTVVDACGDGIVVMTNEFTSGNPCPGGGIILRTWVAFDCIGNMATHVQTITVED